MLETLLLTLGGSADHHIAPAVAWHARTMVAAWVIAVPAGALVARFFKVTPRQDWPAVRDNKLWWRSHLWLQGGGVALSLVGLALALTFAQGATALARWHAALGWFVVGAGLFQVLLGRLRGSKGGPTGAGALPGDPATWRGDHYDMTLRRRVFERLHKSVGWVAIMAAAPATAAGLWLVDAPRWMAWGLGLWWSGLVICFLRWQIAGRCLDTYQAIWGADTEHPGNRVAPIGWGVRRRPAMRHNATFAGQVQGRPR